MSLKLSRTISAHVSLMYSQSKASGAREEEKTVDTWGEIRRFSSIIRVRVSGGEAGGRRGLIMTEE